jgi:2-oxo-4-hydroxy-4-carboxy-5-ureidoimidazoline decarboxylase
VTEAGLARFNTVPDTALRDELGRLTAAPRWAAELVAGRPYADVRTLLARSDEILAGIDADQVDAALAGHPRIGQRSAHLDAESAARSAGEQAGMNAADAAQVRALAEANAAYEQRFGRIYLVAAAGLSAQQLLERARSRLHNAPGPELDVVRSELATITRTRLTAWLTGPAQPDDGADR